MNKSLKTTNGQILPLVRTSLNIDIPMFSETPLKSSKDVIEFIAPYVSTLTREVLILVCFDVELNPICISLLGLGKDGTVDFPIKQIMQTSLLANAYAATIIHNHPNSYANHRHAKASALDIKITDIFIKACQLFSIIPLDSIIMNNIIINKKGVPHYYSIRENKNHKLKKITYDKYDCGLLTLAKSTNALRWNEEAYAKRYWGFDVSKQINVPSITSYSPKELENSISLIQEGAFDNEIER